MSQGIAAFVTPAGYPLPVSDFLHSDLGFRANGDVLEVTLSDAANVRLLDSHNFSQYQRGLRHNYYGGLARETPVRIPIPHAGGWHAVVDMQGLAGSTRAGFRVIPRSAFEPLPPIPRATPAQPTITDVISNASDMEQTSPEKEFDVFISYATEDKEAIAGPLALSLRERDVSVWYDEFELRIGDSLRRSIDSGINRSRSGLVILSKAFFDKGWPQYELDGLVTKSNSNKQILLPIWHEISKDEVIERSPSLADKVALRTSVHSIDEIADEIAGVIADRRNQ